MEDFLKKLFNPSIKLSLCLLEAKDLADEYEEQELSSYIDKEINGYTFEDGFPEYRKIRGQIVVDVNDVYGNLTNKNFPVDFSVLSKKVGFNLDVVYIPDGISFIETWFAKITGDIAIKQIPKPLIKMLDESFHYNNQNHHLVAAYHSIPSVTLEYIFVKIRQNLIQSFQKLDRKIKKKQNEIYVENIIESDSAVSKIKNVFVTYAWEGEEYNSKIISFVDFLRKNGFDASMDKKRSQQETSMNFNQMMIEGIQNSNKVIVVLSKKYKEKADKFEGGVWQELGIIIEEIKQKSNKYVFVYFGGDDRKDITPTAVLGKDILDLKKDQDENEFNSLFAKLKEENIIEFSEVSEKEIEIKKIEIRPFKL